ncbi:MAG: PaaI family thioesterase [Eubacteriaceae bacterium]|jgi:acyl-CoA thioesterase
MDYEELRVLREKNDVFPNELGIVIKKISAGYADGELVIRPDHMNVIHAVHGGVLFGLADTVCGNAAASYGIPMTTISGTMNFLNAAMEGKSSKLFATAREIKHGRKICFYDVDIHDDNDRLIAQGTYTFFALEDKKNILSPDYAAGIEDATKK